MNRGQAANPMQRRVEEYLLLVEKLGSKTTGEGTFPSLMRAIHEGAKQRAEREKRNPEPFQTIHPVTVNGKYVLPRCDECFVVRVRNTLGESVCYLFQWRTLYCPGFYVDDTENQQNQCWYLFSDFNKDILPSADQYPYNPRNGVGWFIMNVKSNYQEMGDKSLKLGSVAFDSYVSKLFNIRSRLQHGIKPKLKLSDDLKAELRKGPFTFGPVIISEASRFLEYQYFLVRNIDLDIWVPYEHSNLFTSWSDICLVIEEGNNFTKSYKDENDKEVHIMWTAEEAKLMISLMCNRVLRASD